MKILTFHYQLNETPPEQYLINLSPKEREVYETFTNKSHQFQFAERHTQLHVALSDFLNTHKKVEIIQLENGIWKAKDYPDLNITLSSSNNLYVIGLSYEQIGVDIEFVKPILEKDEMVNMFFHSKEIKEYGQAKEEDKLAYFYKIWTGKEAYIKAIGEKELDEMYIPFQNLMATIENGFTFHWFTILEDYLLCILSKRIILNESELNIHWES